jgi:hypothetical protein
MNNEVNVQENGTQNNQSKSSSSLVIVLLLIIILALGGYIIYDNFIKKDNNNNNNNDNTNVVDTSNKVLVDKFFASTQNEVIVNDAKLGSNTVDIKLSKTDNGETNKLYVDNKEVLSTKSIGDVIRWGDIILVDYNSSLDLSGNEFRGYDYTGKEVFNIITAVDREETIAPFGFKLRQSENKTTDKVYYFENGKLYIYLMNEFNGMLNLPSSQYAYADLCDDTDLAQKNIPDTYKVEFKYEISYLGSSKFSTPSIISSMTVADYQTAICNL